MKAAALLLGFLALSLSAATLPPHWQVADTNLAAHFAEQTEALSRRCLSGVTNAAGWRDQAPVLRGQLAEMLGLSPLPARGDLKATVTGRIEHDEFTVEKLHFQSLPHLYVTANLYVPKGLKAPAPTVLYVCGHSPIITNRVSYGTKAAYQHHGVWFARNGYVCLVIDTLESGEILGQHHGTYREGMWWWNSRGYTPAGVETWNGMRALDYLGTRPEVDTNRFAITGRSGGGAYSWFITAMDDRIRCAAPVAGITDLNNLVVDGAVEGHCDCMFFVNTHRWDYPQLAALAAPRPLLICNTDDDNLFPLDGVVRLRDKVRRIYNLLGAGEKCGLVITPGPHQDAQELQVPVMRWFNQHLRGTNALIVSAAEKLFTPAQLKVFQELPADAINADIHATFVPAARALWPTTKDDWTRQRELWMAGLRENCFRAWPGPGAAPALREQLRTDWKELQRGLAKLMPESAASFKASAKMDWPTVADYTHETFSRGSARLTLELPQKPAALNLHVASGTGGRSIQSRFGSPLASAWLDLPSLITNATPANLKKEVQLRRRFMLLGTTADSLRVWDIVQAVKAVRATKELANIPLRLHASGDMAVNALYASLFTRVDGLVLTRLPASHERGPDYPNVQRILDVPQAVAMACERCPVELRETEPAQWSEVTRATERFGWEDRLCIVPSTPPPPR